MASIWIDYVPSDSNPADIPSRFHEMSEDEIAEAADELGDLMEMVVPTFTDEQGNWLSSKSIASALWGEA